jgi:hypothetical protein
VGVAEENALYAPLSHQSVLSNSVALQPLLVRYILLMQEEMLFFKLGALTNKCVLMEGIACLVNSFVN